MLLCFPIFYLHVYVFTSRVFFDYMLKRWSSFFSFIGNQGFVKIFFSVDECAVFFTEYIR